MLLSMPQMTAAIFTTGGKSVSRFAVLGLVCVQLWNVKGEHAPLKKLTSLCGELEEFCRVIFVV